MVRTAALAIILAAAPVGPAKLVVIFSSQGIAITDYPSMERCERGRRALLDAASRGQELSSGATLVPIVSAYCIPG